VLQSEENKEKSPGGLENASDEAIKREFFRRFGEIRKPGPARGNGKPYPCKYCGVIFDATGYRGHSRRECKARKEHPSASNAQIPQSVNP
jgi:hypothetical protein